MSIITIPYIFTVGAVILAAQHNSNFQVIFSDYNGNIQDVNIATNAAIEYSKLSLNASILYGDLASSTITSLRSNVGVPSGAIIMWSGAISAIPSGWFLCNGSNSTPDLRDRFVICADADSAGTYNVGDTGDGSIPSHVHSISTDKFSDQGTLISNTVGGAGFARNINTAAFGTGTKVIATYYALAYIMKS